MQAAYYEQLGAARAVLHVGEVDTPQAGPGEVCVRVHTSGINPSDVKRRSGWSASSMAFPRIIPHQDGAGIITAVGEGVSPARIGERVWLYEAQHGRPYGTAAEWVILPSSKAVPLPQNADFPAGACLGVPAMTAHRCVFADGPVQGQTILVTGGAGAVGWYAIQFAKWGGATVVSTVSSMAKATMAHTAGADYMINYRTDDVVAKIQALTGGRGVDRIVEVAFGRNLAVSQRILQDNGVIASYSSTDMREVSLPYYALSARNITVHFVQVYVMSEAAHQAAARDITTCLEQNILRPLPIYHFSLHDIAAAHEAVESGQSTGKVLIDLA